MLFNIDFNEIQNSNFKLEYILVIKTNHNQEFIQKQVENELVKIVNKIFVYHNKCSINNISIDNKSTIIISFEAHPNVQLSKLINSFKTVSSRLIKSKFSNDLKSKGVANGFWERKYYIYTKDAA